ncbi:hypothetical protein TWF694_009244 [Orbilia ellipsospora]|uniref:Ricin B lectin domain-containing protein n=1 Tax=Orbilia ellipsospora TaxID=2528407 RepID=A0AAV9XFA6_9PEZI
MEVKEGDYKIINFKTSESALDLSGTDGKTISGWSHTDGDNQKWHITLNSTADAHHIRNAASGKYLAFNGEVRDGFGNTLIVVDEPVDWWLVAAEDGAPHDPNAPIRIMVPRMPFCLDLTDNGDPKPGTRVEVWGKCDLDSQKWLLQHTHVAETKKVPWYKRGHHHHHRKESRECSRERSKERSRERNPRE